MKKAAIAAILLWLCSGSSQAQPAVTNSSRSELLRVLASEARWDAPRSHAAMLHVLQGYASRNNVSIVEAANAIVWPFSNAQYDHPWTRYITESCEKPDYYRAQWPREKCLHVLSTIDAFLAGKLIDPCNGKASGWRSPRSKALRYALRHGLQRVKCRGGTSLAFVGQQIEKRQHAKRSEKRRTEEEGKASSRRRTKVALRNDPPRATSGE